MSFDSGSDSETELLLLNDRSNRINQESDYTFNRRTKKNSTSVMGSLKQLCCR